MEIQTTVQLRRYLAELAAYRGGLAVTLGVMLGVGLLEGVGLMLLLPLLALVGLEGRPDHPMAEGVRRLFDTLGLPLTLPGLLALFVGLVGAKLLLAHWRDLRSARLRLGFTDHLRSRLYRHIAFSEWSFFSLTRTSDFTHALTSEVQRIGQGTYHVLQFATGAALAAAYLLAAVGVSTAFTGVALLFGVLLMLPLRRIQRRTVELGSGLSRTQRQLFAASSELLGGMKAAKAHGAEARHVEQFVRHAEGQRRAQLAFQRLHGLARVVYQWGAAAVLAMMVWWAVEGVRLPATELLVLIAIFSRLAPMLSGLQQNYQQILHMLPAYAAFRAMETACAEAAEPPDETVEPPPFRRGLRLEGVAFRYRKERAQPVLAGIDLYIPVRATVALVGPSGGGKSTLADLIAGLLVADAGCISVDGVPLKGGLRRAWRRRVAYVPQETFLLHDTVRANLLWAAPEVDEAALARALRLAAAEGFVAALPEGIDTVVGERGVRLSGGERQRIALARALLQEPELLILDEATSALDRENERLIQEALDALHGNLTLLVIAHRLSTVRHADRIVVLEEGRVVEVGGWQELAEKSGGRLRRMVDGAPAADAPQEEIFGEEPTFSIRSIRTPIP
ncbi:ABC transporter ATP-binding protein [Endothiovibrio diazotrophicus]